MTKESSDTRFDLALRKVKNHPALVVLLLIGLGVVAVGQLTGAIDSIYRFVAKSYNDQAPHPGEFPHKAEGDVEVPGQHRLFDKTAVASFIPPNADEILRARCEKEYGTDFRMREYCIRTQREALEKLDTLNASPSIEGDIIKVKCKEEYGTDFRMLQYCVRLQWEGLAKLSEFPQGMPENAVNAVRSRCFNEYPSDFRMRAYCQRMQFEAYEKLQQ